MIARPQTAFAMRPYLPDDAPVLADIFRASIEELTSEDYSEAQQDAWASSADEESFAEKLGSALTLIATLEGTPIGFATLEHNTTLDMLYVHPAVAGRGVATMLVDALEKLATARGTKRLTAEASDTAKPFFEKRGYVAQQRNTVTRGDEWLTNTTMSKDLAAMNAGGGKTQ